MAIIVEVVQAVVAVDVSTTEAPVIEASHDRIEVDVSNRTVVVISP